MHNQQRAFIEKIMQYGMLAVLLLCAFFLPGFSARQNTADDASASLAPVSAQDHGKGTIVLDPGHGGDDPGMTRKQQNHGKNTESHLCQKAGAAFYRCRLPCRSDPGDRGRTL